MDETADIARHYTLDFDCNASVSSSVIDKRESVASASASTETYNYAETTIPCDSLGLKSSDTFLLLRNDSTSLADYSPYAIQLSPENQSSISSASPDFSHSSLVSFASRDYAATVDGGLPTLDEHEACLMRYFVVNLAPWFDLCDGKRHFACTVPLRARTCPPLLNAIYTASARHLSRIKKYYTGNSVHYGGKVLPNLTPETAIHYHNQCIAHFVALSNHSHETRDENLLAAAVILRFYEEVDIPLIGQDTESALRGVQIFLDAQAISAVAGSGLRHAAYWIALRQEITTSFSKQRSFRLPLGPCDPYRSFDPADDYVWADRLVIHCADVLQYCFGSEEENVPHAQYHNTSSAGILHLAPATDVRIACYDELVAFETHWTELDLPGFKPIYTRESDRQRGEVFPELWYLNNCHVAGLQFLELARILLTVYNPRLPRLGLGQRTAMRSVDLQVRSIVVRLCGIALSNPHSPPGLVTASAAIGMCGDRFSDRLEQEALLGVLMKLEDEHAYPTSGTQEQLKRAWGWEGYDGE
ncbi:hypothetical protein N7495_000759 [Penicillium taxi]|uniref:uncharacterized protein n=1 Tax=Penicillium taxi TaxID=168475 RepID=UPI002545799F|nr:uncharacterized protein N7495_000759 [Penicillium taxi]KAJ5908077.1 hypothetical protein N7495_000759 [Penicillium taxi]